MLLGINAELIMLSQANWRKVGVLHRQLHLRN